MKKKPPPTDGGKGDIPRQAPTTLTRPDEDPVPHLRARLRFDRNGVSLDRVIGFDKRIDRSDFVVGEWIFDVRARGRRLVLTSAIDPLQLVANGRPVASDHFQGRAESGDVNVDIPLPEQVEIGEIAIHVLRLAEPIRSKAELERRLDSKEVKIESQTEVSLGKGPPKPTPAPQGY
jgi:hypothetical protein